MLRTNSLVIAVLVAAPLAADWTPVVANHRRSVSQVSDSGEEKVLTEEVGRFLRSSKGRQLVTTKAQGNASAGLSGLLTELSDGSVWRIFFDRKIAVQQRVATGGNLQGPRRNPELENSKSIGEAVINGIPCKKFPVRGDGILSGYACRDVENDLLVRVEFVAERGGLKYRTVREMLDIRLNVEPEEEDLAIPSGFQRVESTQ